MIGITAGKRPVSPGKSVKTWDLTIKIGIGELNGEGNPEDIELIDDSLVAVDVPCSGGLWNLPKEKGRGRQGGFAGGGLYLFKQPVVGEVGYEWVGDYCGKYQLADVVNPPLAFPYELSDLTVELIIQHQITPPETVTDLGQNYWTFTLRWTDGDNPDPGLAYTIYTLTAQTDEGPGKEGTLDDEGWVVLFEQALATLSSYVREPPPDPLPEPPPELPQGPQPPPPLWEGFLSFTVEISRLPHGT